MEKEKKNTIETISKYNRSIVEKNEDKNITPSEQFQNSIECIFCRYR